MAFSHLCPSLRAIRDPQTGNIEDFRCLVVNPILARAFHKSREDLIGKIVFKKILRRFDPFLFEEFVQLVETGDSLERDIYYPWEESSWYHFVAVRLGDGFAITVRDITSRKIIELELQEANKSLELLASIDGLTQVANRRRFDEYLALEWEIHRREKKPL